tara:strand:- start:2051 stop:2749 length:699 start_codon:yes stop_codon:yes gene_type:complete
MDNLKNNFFLIIKPNLFAFHIVSADRKILYNKEVSYNELNLEDNFDLLKKFLDNNIFESEKRFSSFIEDVNLIIEDKNFISIDLSLIKDFKNVAENFDNISNDLSIIKKNVMQSNIDTQLVHMLINKFIIDKKEYLELPKDIDNKKFFVQMRLICIKKKILLNLKKILAIYQISIKKIFSYEYVNSFITDGSDQISVVANKLAKGMNKNEISFMEKNSKNIGFFEKFFKFFS